MNYTYCIALDVENTTCGNEKLREIIEIRAVAIDLSSKKKLSKFSSFVEPMRNENVVLSDLCKSITGISQNTINNSDTMRVVLQDFAGWIREIKWKGINLTTNGTNGNCCITTWSNNDLRSLRNDLISKNLPFPDEFNVGLDLQALFAKYFANGNVESLEKAVNRAGFVYEGVPHSAIGDALNTASLAGYMASKGVWLNSNHIEKY